MFEVLTDPAIYEFENQPPPSESSLAARYATLKTRQSPDGKQSWLNWVIRLPSGELAGHVQATLLGDGAAIMAYELASKYWRQGIATTAVGAVLTELELSYAVNLFVAVLKLRNHRSLGLLRKLGFQSASTEHVTRFRTVMDEVVMVKTGTPGTSTKHFEGELLTK
jgi:RimJ/RimL family protein N-acetyltransferase